ncbi:unnamed protein product [[Actinomadura] parvosata subsp. kistnae]|uniref:Hemerythrin n=1 Tax=[Actinomadura] parvosata subsp. kistnae TaxID=1909395 RepID=A0A1U9ZYY3_9ACTN|nr:DUF2249 domain-containing protein [Nonomuraea sp. ATCC 55076]AQZ63158.1 hypothetical protein BKM31_18320 [Nonomuraea sp. ATCC 55076]SPL98808.1 unnamed protein product [Actinomadura parvosata subsp. kistnae]
MTIHADASTQAAVLGRIRAHHDQLGRTMSDHAVTIARSIDRLTSPAARQAVLTVFCTDEVLPHAAVEEQTLYAAAADLPATELLVRAMRDEHATLRALTTELAVATTPGEIVSVSSALNALFQAHLKKENDVLLPALADQGVDLAALLGDAHEILGDPGATPCCGCAAGGPGAEATRHASPVAELDVRRLAPARRHEQIFAAFRELAAGTAFVLVNDHDPKPLYYQFAAEYPGGFTWDYVESGPAVWKVRIGRP